MDGTNIMNTIHKNITRIPEIDENDISRKESIIHNKRNSFSSAHQKNKKTHDNNTSTISIQEKDNVIHFPSLIDLKNFKQPQYIAYSDSHINGDLILQDLKGELWLQPSSSILSKKSEKRLRLKLENTSKPLKPIIDKEKDKSIKGNDKNSKNSNEHDSKNNISDSNINTSIMGFDTSFKRNFDKHFIDVQKLIGIA